MATANTATTTASPNPTAQANASLSANANIPAGQAGSPWTAAPVTQAPGTGTGVPTNTSTPQASTTVQSNDNTINNTVPAIQNTTNNLANTSGVSTNSSGQPTYSNGTLVQPPAGETYVNGQLTYTGTNGTGTNNNISPTGTLITGGYIGDTYYAPGTLAANIPTDANGQPQQLSSQGSTDSQILQNLQTAKSQADSLTASLIDSITSQYNSLIQNQQQANSSQQATVGHSLIKEGTSQLDPIGAAQVTQAQVSYGLSQIASLQSKEQSAIIQAQQAGQDEDFKLMDDMNQEAQSVRTEQQDAAQKILDAVSAVNATAAANKLQASNDDFVTKELQAGITDPQQILADAQKAGNTDLTAKQVADSIAALSPTADELNRQQAAIQFAVTNGVTQPYYLVGNTAIDTKTGLPVTLQQYQAATGQSGKSETDTDFSQIQSLASPDVKALMDKYPDAGILPTDTSAQATAKLQNSALYRKDTYIAPTILQQDEDAGILTSQQNSTFQQSDQALNNGKTGVALQNATNSYGAITKIDPNTTNPAQQQQALMDLAQLEFPGTTSARGLLSVNPDTSQNSGFTNLLIDAQQTLQAKGQLGSGVLSNLQKQAEGLYGNIQTNYNEGYLANVNSAAARTGMSPAQVIQKGYITNLSAGQPVTINGQQYTSGSIVTNSKGQQAYVNPDGTLTLLQ